MYTTQQYTPKIITHNTFLNPKKNSQQIRKTNTIKNIKIKAEITFLSLAESPHCQNVQK